MRASKHRWPALALALGALAGARAADLPTLVPDGVQFYLEVADLGVLLQELGGEDTRLGRLQAAEAGRRFLQGKLPLKLSERLREWLDGPFGDGGLGKVSRALAAGRGALAVYDLENLRFLVVLEDPQGARGQALVGLATEPPRKETRAGEPVEVLGVGNQALHLRRGGGWLRLASHPRPLDRALDASGARLATDAGFQRQAAGLPADLLRLYLAPEVFETVYMKNYWAGGSKAAPPARAVGAALTRAERGYREVRRRDAEALEPRPAARQLARFLPAWTFREVQGGGAPATLLDLLAPEPETPAGEAARVVLANRFATWTGATQAWGSAGGMVEADPGAYQVGDAPAEGFSDTWPPARGLHRTSRAVVALEFPSGQAPEASAVAEAFAAARRADLGPAGKDRVPPEVGDLVVEVAREGDVLLLARGPGALGAARAGQGPALGKDRADLVGAFAVDGPALRREAGWMIQASEARADWWSRHQGEVVKDFLADAMDASAGDLRGVHGLRLARRDGGAEELVEYELAR